MPEPKAKRESQIRDADSDHCRAGRSEPAGPYTAGDLGILLFARVCEKGNSLTLTRAKDHEYVRGLRDAHMMDANLLYGVGFTNGAVSGQCTRDPNTCEHPYCEFPRCREPETELRKSPDPNCPWCLGDGAVDSGGFTPWDAAIYVACGCTYDSPIPPLVRAAADDMGRRLVKALRKLQCGVWGSFTRVRTDRAKSESSLSTRTRARMPVL